MKQTILPIVDEDGENLALRSFLTGLELGIETVGQMADHMRLSGWNYFWPEFVTTSHKDEHLTKAGKQEWIRHLIWMEMRAPTDKVPQQVSGWIEFNGGACPVQPGTYVEVKQRLGNTTAAILAESISWEWHKDPYNKDLDIVAYRIVGYTEAALEKSRQVSNTPQDGWKVTRSIIKECPALIVPQTLLQKLGSTAQIIPLPGFTEQAANEMANALNSTPPQQQEQSGEDYKTCDICNGAKGGVPGNGNIIDGRVVCDYCHADGSYRSTPTPTSDQTGREPS
jgi:hypothetical protein